MKVVVHSLKVSLREHPMTKASYARLGELAAQVRMAISRSITGRNFPATFFDKLYSKQADPWSYKGSELSARRRDLILKVLPRKAYPSLLEIGCGEGWMSPMLASRAERFTGLDISTCALERALAECASLSNIKLLQGDIVADEIAGQFDAIICAGVLVYVAPEAQAATREKLVAALSPGGDLVLENHLGEYPGQVAGPIVHAIFADDRALTLLSCETGEGYCVSVFRKKST